MLARFLATLAADRRGATAVEYGLIATLISVAAIGAFASLGNEVGTTFDKVEDAASGSNG